MIKNYFPEKLNSEVKKLSDKFDKIKQDKPVLRNRLKEIIYTIVEIKDEDDLKLFSYGLTKSELKAVANYMQNNYLNVDLNSLIRVFIIINDFSYFKIIYNSWQSNCIKPYDKEVIIKLLSNYKADIANEYNIKEINVLAQWMSSYDAAALIYDFINKKYKINTIKDFELQLSQLQINNQYLLYRKIKAEFLLNCNRTVYLNMGDMKLYKAIHQLNLEYQRKVLYNFLEVIDTDDLGDFETIAEYSHDELFGDINDSIYRQTIKKQSSLIQTNYNILINIFWLIRLFGRDRRSRFWKKYIKKFNVNYYRAHDMLVMKFKRCSVIEFKEVGPAYFFDTDVLNRNYLNSRLNQSTQEFKYDLRNNEEYLYIKEHRGGWERYISQHLYKYAL